MRTTTFPGAAVHTCPDAGSNAVELFSGVSLQTVTYSDAGSAEWTAPPTAT